MLVIIALLMIVMIIGLNDVTRNFALVEKTGAETEKSIKSIKSNVSGIFSAVDR